MIPLLIQGQYITFVIVLAGIILSLSFHEWGHAYAAKRLGDDTAEMQGRLTLNPVPHIDPMGLLFVVLIGFGYARPVPVNPRNLTAEWADMVIAAAGPFINLLIAFVLVNVLTLGYQQGWSFVAIPIVTQILQTLIFLNLLLMLFNLLPVGPLDGHYILPHFLPAGLARQYRYWNARYGHFGLLGLMLLSFMGLPVFDYVRTASQWLIPHLALFA